MIVPSEPELGEQQQCHDCRDWYPLDDEFWCRNVKRRCGFSHICIACFHDRYRTPEFRAREAARHRTDEYRRVNRERMRQRRAEKRVAA